MINQQESSKNIAFSFPVFFAGAVFGSVITYFYDPDSGNRRKALLRDKATSLKKDASDYGEKMALDMKNRSQGIAAGMRSTTQTEATAEDDDMKLVQRVRSSFGREISHPRSVDVTANKGIITLSGLILRDEVDDLLECVRKVKGVRDVVNNLDAFETGAHISGLQGEGPKYLQS